MKRAHAVKMAGHWDSGGAVDQVLLDAHERQRRRVVLTGERGTTFLLDLPQVIALRDGDGLVLDDGGIVRVIGRPEALVEIAAADSHVLARLAWHIGNRHLPAQITSGRILIREDSVIEDMLKGLGAAVRHVDEPFTPEPGAYDSSHALLFAPGHAGHGHSHG